MVRFLLFALACSQPDTVVSDTDTHEGDWTEWSFQDDSGVDVDHSEAYIERLEALVEVLPTLVAQPMLDAHVLAMERSTDSSPELTIIETDTLYSTYWMGLYRTPEDVVFNGPLSYWDAVDEPVQGAGPDAVLQHYLNFQNRDGLWSFEGIGGQADIFATDGSLDFTCACYANTGTVKLDTGADGWFTQLGGISGFGDEALLEGTWMEGGELRPELDQFYTELDGQRTAELDGSLMWALEDIGIEVELEISGDASGTCVEGHAGTGLLFTPESGWVSFEMATQRDCKLCIEGDSLCTMPLTLLTWDEAPL